MRSSGASQRRSPISIDGAIPNETRTPDSAAEVAEVLAEAAANQRKVAPVGGGTALAMGNPPAAIDIALSTERLSTVLDYEPTDLVLSVGAGARFGDVQAILAERGQRLPLDPPDGADATIGGLIATGRWGPLRHSSGTLRDLLIGMSVAHPSGTISKSGGMVVKNVTGYDMPRLFHGSLGTLGVIVSANFKVFPRPRAESTVLASFQDARSAFGMASAIHSNSEAVAALEVTRAASAWRLAAKVEGREESVRLIAQRVAARANTDVETLEDDASAQFWFDHSNAQSLRGAESQVVLRCGVRPRETGILASGLAAAFAELSLTLGSLTASPGIGTVTARFEPATGFDATSLAEVHAVALGLAENAVILAAPPDWKRGIDVWGRIPEGFSVMEALRDQFDPNRTVNPGRFAGFL